MAVCPLNWDGNKSHFLITMLSNHSPSVPNSVKLRHDEESHESLICSTSVCLGEGLLGNFDATFRGRPAETEGSGGGGGGELEWPSENGTNTQPIEAKIHRHTNWLPVNTHKSSSSSWNSTMRQLWVPAEPDSPTHWASLRQTHTLVPSHADQKHPTLKKPHTLFANRTLHSSEFTQKWNRKLPTTFCPDCLSVLGSSEGKRNVQIDQPKSDLAIWKLDQIETEMLKVLESALSRCHLIAVKWLNANCWYGWLVIVKVQVRVLLLKHLLTCLFFIKPSLISYNVITKLHTRAATLICTYWLHKQASPGGNWKY